MGLIIDLFAGGGGASTGIEMALGRSPDIAINHSPVAVAMHAANHPGTLHFCQDVWAVQPLHATKGRPVDLLWGSPDCRHFSKATSKDRMGLVTVTIGGEPYVIADIGMRMLQPRELFRAQGFPDSYIIEFPFNGKPLPKSAQVRCCGNSVCPDLSAALVRANCIDLAEIEPRTWGLEVAR